MGIDPYQAEHELPLWQRELALEGLRAEFGIVTEDEGDEPDEQDEQDDGGTDAVDDDAELDTSGDPFAQIPAGLRGLS